MRHLCCFQFAVGLSECLRVQYETVNVNWRGRSLTVARTRMHVCVSLWAECVKKGPEFAACRALVQSVAEGLMAAGDRLSSLTIFAKVCPHSHRVSVVRTCARASAKCEGGHVCARAPLPLQEEDGRLCLLWGGGCDVFAQVRVGHVEHVKCDACGATMCCVSLCAACRRGNWARRRRCFDSPPAMARPQPPSRKHASSAHRTLSSSCMRVFVGGAVLLCVHLRTCACLYVCVCVSLDIVLSVMVDSRMACGSLGCDGEHVCLFLSAWCRFEFPPGKLAAVCEPLRGLTSASGLPTPHSPRPPFVECHACHRTGACISASSRLDVCGCARALLVPPYPSPPQALTLPTTA